MSKGVPQEVINESKAKMRAIKDVLSKVSIPDDSVAFDPVGRYVAKINLEYINKLSEKDSRIFFCINFFFSFGSSI